MTTSLMPLPKFRAFDSEGAPLVGGKVYTYEAGTNTELATFTDYSGLSANTNPVILDANGEADIWLEQQKYKIVLKDANDVTQWTVDNVGQNSLVELSAGFGQAIDIASATTVDLGTIATHFANITGTTTINGFGSSAELTAPIYLIKFNGALTITNSANLITRTGANITTAKNDRALVEYIGSGAWRIIDYMRADGASDVSNATGVLATANGGTGASTVDAARANLGLSALGFIYGLTLANNASDANNDIDIAVGRAASGNGVMMVLGSALTKRLDASWVAGTNQGGLDTGSKANSTWYHMYLISNGTTVDVLFSTSASSPTMPSGYTEKRRIGSVYTDSSGNITAFYQVGNEFYWKTPLLSISGGGSTAGALFTVGTPLGISTLALIYGTAQNTDAANIRRIITSPSVNNLDPATYCNAGAGRSSLTIEIAFSLQVRTDTSSQLRLRTTANAGNITIYTEGWVDDRGRF